MGTFLIWVIGKDQYSEGLIYYLSKMDNVLISTTNVEYVNDKVRILSPCDMNELKADAIILPYSHNISLGKVGRLQLNEDFFEKQKDALFFSTNISNYSKNFAHKNKIKLYSLFDLEQTKEVKKIAIIDLILLAVIEHSEIMLQHIDFGIIQDNELSSTLIDYFTKSNLSYVISDNIDSLLDQNVIIVPTDKALDKSKLEKYKSNPFLIINLYEDNLSFSIIKNSRIIKVYSLRMTRYALLSYAYSFSEGIYNLLINSNQQK
ncbi:MAG: hypothetical protein IJV94_00120 [Bacilli bacterium]|nr:hypothetical protein [Bacilli bacterium]